MPAVHCGQCIVLQHCYDPFPLLAGFLTVKMLFLPVCAHQPFHSHYPVPILELFFLSPVIPANPASLVSGDLRHPVR